MSDTNRAASAVTDASYLADQEAAPAPFKDSALEEVSATILAFVAGQSLLHLGYLDGDQWPIGAARYYATGTPAGARPVLYVAFPADCPEVGHLKADGRVSASIFLATGFERRREAKSLQLQAIATIVEGTAERQAAVQDLAARGAEALPNGPSDATIFRIEPAAAVLFNAAGRPQWGFIDYARLPEVE